MLKKKCIDILILCTDTGFNARVWLLGTPEAFYNLEWSLCVEVISKKQRGIGGGGLEQIISTPFNPLLEGV